MSNTEQTNIFGELAEIEISYKQKVKSAERFKIITSRDIADAAALIFNADQIAWREEFIILLLNRANRVLGFVKISTGGMAGTVVDPKIIFSVALKCCASSLILMHNHPSGNIKPSEADIRLTKNLVQAAKVLEICVLDHLIISPDGAFYSFSDEGMM